ncbi:prostasin-like [Ornithodoros turicata]|uniref:prostasin-like n=1 Tax=Ornithodoros turicata TaxID=34597 RepID=UPI003138CA7C
MTVNIAGCGNRLKTGDAKRIMGGEDATPLEFPWQVAVLRNGQQTCGASVLSDEWVISAARCFEDSSSSYALLFGRHDLNKPEPSQESRLLQKDEIIRHENFDFHRNFDYDVALIRLSEPLRFDNPNVKPVCLPTAGEDFTKVLCTASGWGIMAPDGPPPAVLQKVDVPVWKEEECKTALFPAITNTMMCAGYENGGKDICNGDFGGPLICPRNHNNETWVLAGISSWSNGCGEPHTPGVYTRVTAVLRWIKDKMGQL